MRDLNVLSGDVQLAVRDFGGSGSPILLLHGLGRTLIDWSIVGPALARSRKTVAFDIRGHGKSGDGPWSWEAAVGFIDAVANELELEKPAVAGHSLGGVRAVTWAETHQQAPAAVNIDGHGKRTLDQYVGIDPEDARRRIAEADDRVKASLAALSGPLPSPMVEGLLQQQRALAAQLGAPPEMFVESIERTLVRENGSALLRPSPAGLGAHILADAESLDMFSLYPKVACPILDIAGTDPDPGLDQELLRAYRAGLHRDLEHLTGTQPNVSLEFIGGGHGLLFERPEAIASLISDFLDVRTHHRLTRDAIPGADENFE